MESIHWLILIIIIVLVLICILLYYSNKNTKSDKKLVFTNLTDQPSNLEIYSSKTGNLLFDSKINPNERRILDNFGEPINIKFINPINHELSIEHLNFVLVDKSAEFTLHPDSGSSQFLNNIDSSKTSVTFNFGTVINTQVLIELSAEAKLFYNGTANIRGGKVTLNNISFEQYFCINTNLSDVQAVLVLLGNFALSNPTPDAVTYNVVLKSMMNEQYIYVFKEIDQCYTN